MYLCVSPDCIGYIFRTRYATKCPATLDGEIEDRVKGNYNRNRNLRDHLSMS